MPSGEGCVITATAANTVVTARSACGFEPLAGDGGRSVLPDGKTYEEEAYDSMVALVYAMGALLIALAAGAVLLWRWLT